MTNLQTYAVALLATSLIVATPPIHAERNTSASKKKIDVTAKSGKASGSKPSSSASGQVLDGFEAADWSPSNHEKTTIAVESAAGKQGKALRIFYDLKDTKQWVAVSKSIPIQSIEGKALEFWIKGQGSANVLEVKLVDADDTNFGVKIPAATKNRDWTRLRVNAADLDYWWGGDNTLGAVRDIYFAISAGEGRSGEVLLDELRLVPAEAASASAGGVISDGETTLGWMPAQADGANITITTRKGQTGKALAADYTVPANQWVAMKKKIDASVEPGAAFIFSIKGEGAANNFEFKVVDADQSVFGKTFSGLAGNNAWQEVRVPISELKYLWGGDDKLDMANVRYLDLAISGPGGTGTVLLDNIRLVSSGTPTR
jgi:hypothetical protein